MLRHKSSSARSATVEPTSLQVTSSAFAEGQEIPKQFSAEAENVSPAIKWSAGPNGTKYYAIIVDDPDAPTPQPFVHWVIYDIPASTTSLNEAVPKIKTLASGASQGKNSTGATGYYGPRPPSGTHRYYFKVYALDKQTDLAPGASKDDLLDAIEGHILAQGVLMGTFARK